MVLETDVDLVREQLQHDEGFRAKPYKDTAGKLSIGFGHNLTDRGIPRAVALLLLEHDLREAVADLELHLPWVKTLDGQRQRVLVNMCFNLGIGKLLGFRKFLAAVEGQDWVTAAVEMRASRWATQVGPRADRLIDQMLGL